MTKAQEKKVNSQRRLLTARDEELLNRLEVKLWVYPDRLEVRGNVLVGRYSES